jgi:hypothetical protein
MTPHRNAKWPRVIAALKAKPGDWQKVADDVGPSTIQRLRELGAEVQLHSNAPRTDGVTYSRYTVYARWPTPNSELERVELEHAKLTELLEEVKQDVKAADEEYASAKRILNRSSYRRKAAREKYEPLLEQHDQLTSLLNRLKTEKD